MADAVRIRRAFMACKRHVELALEDMKVLEETARSDAAEDLAICVKALKAIVTSVERNGNADYTRRRVLGIARAALVTIGEDRK